MHVSKCSTTITGTTIDVVRSGSASRNAIQSSPKKMVHGIKSTMNMFTSRPIQTEAYEPEEHAEGASSRLSSGSLRERRCKVRQSSSHPMGR